MWGEGYNAGWTASADGADLGSPSPVANGNAWWRPASTSTAVVHLRWAPQRGEAIALGVSALAALEGHSVGATTIRIKTAVTMVEAASCQVMYIADSEARRVSAILGSLAALPILTVSEIDGFIDQGGMIGLVAQDDRYVFEINLDAAHALGLMPNTSMLRLARRVIHLKAR